MTPHVAQNITKHRGSMIDARTTRHAGYAISQRIRKRIEEIFGWIKTTGNFRKTRYVGFGANQVAALLARRGLQPGQDAEADGSDVRTEHRAIDARSLGRPREL